MEGHSSRLEQGENKTSELKHSIVIKEKKQKNSSSNNSRAA
jgi:hypothetical protein